MWEKVRNKQRKGYSADIVVKRDFIYIPSESRIKEGFVDVNRYDVFVERDKGMVAIVPDKNGEFVVPKSWRIYSYRSRLTPVAVFNEILGIGKYEAKKGNVNGKFAYVFYKGSD